MGCPEFWDTPLHIFAADNTIVELKYKRYGWIIHFVSIDDLTWRNAERLC